MVNIGTRMLSKKEDTMKTKLRVAAYCRVSTDKEEQSNSLESQRKYFREYIEKQKDWTLVKIFYDEGTSGTQTAKNTRR